MAVVDALLSLIDRGNLRPTAREVADEARVSLRSVYVHFDDVESLFVAAVERNYERLAALVTPWDAGGSVDDRVERFVDQRRRLNEEGANARHAALLQEPFSPVLRSALRQGRAYLRTGVEQAFGPEIAAVPEREQARLRGAIEVVVSAATWDDLRAHQDLSPDAAAALVVDMLHATLRAWEPAGPSIPATGDSRPDSERPPG